MAAVVDLAEWSPTGLELLGRSNTPGQKEHVGGPETPAQLLRRHYRYLGESHPGSTEMFEIRVDRHAAGSIGYWERRWKGDLVYETGWGVLPQFQGRGVAIRACRLLIGRLRGLARRRHLHAFPSPDNGPSNGICRRLGFVLTGVTEFEYPPGHLMQSNDWLLDLRRA